MYNYVTQPQASERCQSMYANKPYESDLVNSYAWDTAIIFFQEFGKNTKYAIKTSSNSSFINMGTSGTNYVEIEYGGTKDVICNVYDMASNCYEWSTETYSDEDFPCNCRGGMAGSASNASDRSNLVRDVNVADVAFSFRPILYM